MHFKERLAKTLEDHRLSRGEKRALRDILHESPLDDAVRHTTRSLAFDMAREAQRHAKTSAERESVLLWLEEVVKVVEGAPRQEPNRHVEAWFSPDQDCVGRIVRCLEEAQSSADICVFTITDNRISRAIEDAHKRSVRVRVISDDDKAEDLGSDLDRLAQAGVPTAVDTSPHHMHHKFAIFDGSWLLTGSYNWTRSASRDNEENFILTEDPRLIAPFRDQFEDLWRKFGS